MYGWQSVKEIAILAILGEMILFLLPNSSYEKYMRFLMEILILGMMFSKILSTWDTENMLKPLELVWNLENNMDELVSQLDSEITDYYKKEISFGVSYSEGERNGEFGEENGM